MTLQKCRQTRPHDPAKTLRPCPPRGWPHHAATGWPHDPAKISAGWPHEAANRRPANFPSALPIGRLPPTFPARRRSDGCSRQLSQARGRSDGCARQLSTARRRSDAAPANFPGAPPIGRWPPPTFPARCRSDGGPRQLPRRPADRTAVPANFHGALADRPARPPVRRKLLSSRAVAHPKRNRQVLESPADLEGIHGWRPREGAGSGGRRVGRRTDFALPSCRVSGSSSQHVPVTGAFGNIGQHAARARRVDGHAYRVGRCLGDAPDPVELVR